MAQNHLQFDGYTPPDVDEDGYTIALRNIFGRFRAGL